MGEIGLESSGDFDGGADLFVDDLVLPVGCLGNNFDFVELLEPFDNDGRVLATSKHDFRSLFLGLPDESNSERAKANAKNGEEQERNEYCRDDRAAVANSFGQFLAIDDAYVAHRHVSWPPRRRSGA